MLLRGNHFDRAACGGVFCFDPKYRCILRMSARTQRSQKVLRLILVNNILHNMQVTYSAKLEFFHAIISKLLNMAVIL